MPFSYLPFQGVALTLAKSKCLRNLLLKLLFFVLFFQFYIKKTVFSFAFPGLSSLLVGISCIYSDKVEVTLTSNHCLCVSVRFFAVRGDTAANLFLFSSELYHEEYCLSL